MNSSQVNTHQPRARHNDKVEVWDLVRADMTTRNEVGTLKHGTPLQPFNGRQPIVDAYQEALDFIVYIRQGIEEFDRYRDAVVALAQAVRESDEILKAWLPFKPEEANMRMNARTRNHMALELLKDLGL